MRRRLDLWLWLRAVCFVGWLVGTVSLGWLLLVFPHETPRDKDRDFPFLIGERDSLETIADGLLERGVITERTAFVLYMRMHQLSAELLRGWVPVHRALSATALVPRLLRVGAHVPVRVPIPEGLTRFEIASRVERYGITSRTAVLRATENRDLLAAFGIAAPTAEGYLFPATYELLTDSDGREVVRKMLEAFRIRTRRDLARLAAMREAGESELSDEQALILASIVEKEAAVADERPIIAGTFLNRLRNKDFVPHRLQADPTVAYGCLAAPDAAPTCARFDGRRVTPEMVRDPANPYNTYRLEGLPPGPISNPGLASLQAVIDPARHDFFYFVATGDGRHTFSRTLREHNRAVSESR